MKGSAKQVDNYNHDVGGQDKYQSQPFASAHYMKKQQMEGSAKKPVITMKEINEQIFKQNRVGSFDSSQPKFLSSGKINP